MPPEAQKAIKETGHSGPEGAPQEMPTGSYQGSVPVVRAEHEGTSLRG